MVSASVDARANPLSAVRMLAERVQGAAAGGGEVLESSAIEAAPYFESLLAQGGAIDEVPLINNANLDLIPPNSLVRFRGMVQDMYNPEYYMGAYREAGGDGAWKTTKYTDAFEEPISANAETAIWERRPYYCITVPGESPWCRGTAPSSPPPAPTSPASPAPSKRGRDDGGESGVDSPSMVCGMADSAMTDDSGAGTPEATAESKRMREAGLAAAEGGDTAMDEAGDGAAPAPAAALRATGQNGPACIVKLYDGVGEDIKLNDVCEFVGILSKTPQTVRFAGSGDDDGLMQEEVPAGSEAPRIQVLYIRPVEANPSLPAAGEARAAAAAALAPLLPSCRARAVDALAASLGGDRMAAEYVLLVLLSRVHTREDPLVLGNLSLNLIGCPAQPAPAAPPAAAAAALKGKPAPPAPLGRLSPLAESLGRAIEGLVPRTARAPLAIGHLNAGPWVARKNYQSGRVEAGPLQLAAGTVLLLDETAMQDGQLTEVGVRNLVHCKNLIETQKVAYDFEFYQMDMSADVPVVVTSTGKSMLPADITLPLQMTSEPNADAVSGMGAEEVAAVRAYLALVRGAEHSIAPEVGAKIEAELVEERQKDSKVGPDEFHKWLTVARLLSLSHGEGSLTEARWREARGLQHSLAARQRVC